MLPHNNRKFAIIKLTDREIGTSLISICEVSCGAGSAYPSGAPDITPSFWLGSFCFFFLVFYVVSCVLLFVCLSFSFSAMVLSVYFRFMSLTVPLVSFVSLLNMLFAKVSKEIKHKLYISNIISLHLYCICCECFYHF